MARFELDRAVRLLTTAGGESEADRVASLELAGTLLEALGDLAEAEQSYLEAARLAGENAGRRSALTRLAALLERRGDPRRTVEALLPFFDVAPSDVLVRLGMAQLAAGDWEAADNALGLAERRVGHRSECGAIARFGLWEVTRRRTSKEMRGTTHVTDYLTLAGILDKAFPDRSLADLGPTYGALAVSRRANYAARVAECVDSGTLERPTEVTRAGWVHAATERWRKLAAEELSSCANFASEHGWYNPTVRRCMKGLSADAVLPEYDRISVRAGRKAAASAAGLRERVARSPGSLEPLRALGARLLETGDNHEARIIFLTAAAKSNDPEDVNLLGVASHRVGLVTEALEAFALASRAGVRGGRENLLVVLNQLGLSEWAPHRSNHGAKGRRSRLIHSPKPAFSALVAR